MNDKFTVCSLTSEELWFLNIFFASKVAILCSIDILSYIKLYY
jgi:hypothetical protein